MTEIIEVITSFISQLPAEFMYTVMLGMMGYLIKSNKKDKQEILDKFVEDDSRHIEIDECIDAANKRIDKKAQAINQVNKVLEEDIKQSLKEQTMMILRQGITNTNYPREHRLDLYDRYKELKGNSFIDDYVKKELINPTKIEKK